MLKKQAAKGNNGIIKSKYLIFGIESKGFKEARAKLVSIEADVIKNLTNLGTHAKRLTERNVCVSCMSILTRILWSFRFSFKELAESGKSVKDYIAPRDLIFAIRVVLRRENVWQCALSGYYCPKFDDELLKKLLDLDANLTITMHMQTMDRSRRLRC